MKKAPTGTKLRHQRAPNEGTKLRHKAAVSGLEGSMLRQVVATKAGILRAKQLYDKGVGLEYWVPG